MSDPIFQKHGLISAGLRVTGAMVLGPLLGVLVLSVFYFIVGLSFSELFNFEVTSGYGIWLGILFIAAIGLVHSVMLAILSAAMSGKAKLRGYGLIMSGLILAGILAFLFALVGGNYFLILSAVLLLVVIAFEMSRMSFNVCKPYFRWSALSSAKRSA